MANNLKRKRGQLLKKQQGNILVMFTIGLFVLIAMAALAIDSGHLLLNKSRLQNLSDAAALHAAKTLDDGGSHIDARVAVIQILALNIAHSDNFEINDALNLLSVDTSATQVTAQINVDFSEKPDPFISSSSDDADYVKVEIRNLNLNNFLADILNFSKRVSATSLAGPSTAVVECPKNLVPMLVCGDPVAEAAEVPDNPDTIYGLPLNKLYLMKIGSNSNSPIGPGNFQLIRLGDNSGGADIRDAMAGEAFNSENCFSTAGVGSLVPTEPGNTVGPSGQGINTRMGSWQGPVNSTDHPRDWNICQGPQIELDASDAISTEMAGNAYRYSIVDVNGVRVNQYEQDIENGFCSDTENGDPIIIPNAINDTPPNENERRILNVVIGDCSGKNHGASDIPYMGLGCFFLSQDMISGGQNAYIVGEFLFDCSVEGIPEGVAEDNPGPYTIVLYHVPGSKDS